MSSREKKPCQWLFGPSLLAAPLFGSNYDTADARDIYLPEGHGKITIDVRAGSPENVRVAKESGEAVPTKIARNGRGVSFVFEPWTNYKISDTAKP